MKEIKFGESFLYGDTKLKRRGYDVYQYNDKFELVKKFESKKSAIKETGINMNSCLRGTQGSRKAGGYYWVVELNPKKSAKTGVRAVLQFTVNGDFIKEYESRTDVVKEFGTGVCAVLLKRTFTCKKYFFIYKDEYEEISRRFLEL